MKTFELQVIHSLIFAYMRLKTRKSPFPHCVDGDFCFYDLAVNGQASTVAITT